jgi:hypothetical protein
MLQTLETEFEAFFHEEVLFFIVSVATWFEIAHMSYKVEKN